MLTPSDVHALRSAVDRDAAQLFAPRAVLATLIGARGSTFRRPGSRMLVGGGGQVVRGLSGGCPEADIVTRAGRVIETGRGEIVHYNRDYGLDALLELGCGGELEVFLESVEDAAQLGFLDCIARAWRLRQDGFVATVVTRNGICSGQSVQRLVWTGRAAWNDRFDAAAVQALTAAAAPVLEQANSAFVETSLDGAPAGVLFEAIRPPIRVVVVGANAVADALLRQAVNLNWTTLQIHPTEATMQPGLPAPAACDAHFATPARIDDCASYDARTFAVVMTYNLERDISYAAAFLQTPLPYIGIIGSRRRSKTLLERLGEAHGPSAHARIFTPAGLDIGSEDPEEIALSLLAQIKAVAAGRAGRPLRETPEPIHGRAPPALLK